MKAKIHPKYFSNATVTCVCGNIFTTGSTQETIRVELCSKCHPFYTGEQRFVDSASRIQRFKTKQEIASHYQGVKKEKEEKEKVNRSEPKTLREMLNAIK